MFLKSLYLKDFRLYQEKFIEFCPGVNWITGRNAVGKTSLLEAIHLIATGGSFRTHQIGNLIRQGASHFYLEAHFIKHGIEQRIQLGYSQREKRILINNQQCSSLSGLCGVLLAIAFSPDDLSLINGAPQERRRLLDTQLGQIDPLYLHHLIRYQRAMRQRNHLLRAKNLTSIESWEYEMAASAAYLFEKRLELLNGLQSYSLPFHRQISGEAPDLMLTYRPYGRISHASHPLRQQYIEQFQRNRPREIILGSTQVGPHKDDITISIGEQDVRNFGSEGQQRSCAAALRLAQWQQLKEKSELDPLMLVDDIGTSLDPVRCERLFTHLSGLSQLFLSSTQPLPEVLNNHQHTVISL